MDENSKDTDYIKSILAGFPKEKLQIEKILSHTYFNGVAVVRNNKLAGRMENIKFLRSVEPNLRERFLKEGKVLSALEHKNIPRIYDILEHEDFLIFRSENVEGYSLREVLDFLKEKKKDFPRYSAASIILKLMNALYYTHNEVRYEKKKKSIIHCDIKPSNIILSSKNYKRKNKIDDEFIHLLEQNKVEPYLIDFGIARFKDEAKIDEGTLNYLSPAQASVDDTSKLDWRTDIYQLLLVYYEMLTKKKPYANISRKKVLAQKLNQDFQISKQQKISGQIRELIEKGASRDSAKYFLSEKDYIRKMSRIESRQKFFAVARQYRKPISITAIVVVLIFCSFMVYAIWDNQVRSTDAIIKKVEKNPAPTVSELESAVLKIQKRAFEKKYYEPLLKGEFRDKSTGKPAYPSHLDINGEWILTGPETENSGAFVGLLFEYSDRYPDLLKYAVEYAEPVLNSEFDGTAGKRFSYALIPAYEKTHDERYLNKLVNVTDIVVYYFNTQKGMTQCDDLHYADLFLFVYNKTGERRYLEAFDDYVAGFVRNNIDYDGYVYTYVTVNVTTIYGPIPDAKASINMVATKDNPVGNYIELSNTNEKEFKNTTGALSRDFLEMLFSLDKMYEATGNFVYDDASNLTLTFYFDAQGLNKKGNLFVSQYNSNNSFPDDNLATMQAIYFFKEKNESIYNDKLKALLDEQNFNKENENGLLKGNVFIENLNYMSSDESKRNQTLMQTDALFLELQI
jgi:serine/threonine protein kinase